MEGAPGATQTGGKRYYGIGKDGGNLFPAHGSAAATWLQSWLIAWRNHPLMLPHQTWCSNPMLKSSCKNNQVSLKWEKTHTLARKKERKKTAKMCHRKARNQTDTFYASNIYEYKLQSVGLSVHKCNFNVACYSPTWFPLMQPYPRTCKGSCLARAVKIPGCIMPQLFLISLRHTGWQYYHNKPQRIFIATSIVAVSKTKIWLQQRTHLLIFS